MEKNKKFDKMFIRMSPSIRSYVLRKFDEMEEFKHFTISAIEKEKESIQKRQSKATAKLTKREIEDYYEWNSEDYFLVEDVFKNISMYSFIVILYSFVECGLESICNVEYGDRARYNKERGKPPLLIKYKDIRGEGIERSKIYLEKVIGLNLHTGEKPWNEINTLRKIRNAIVHDEGTASDQIIKEGNIKQHVKNGLLEITDHGPDIWGKIIIKHDYLDHILVHAKQFFENIT
jgi:hypothetical protein